MRNSLLLLAAFLMLTIASTAIPSNPLMPPAHADVRQGKFR